MCCRESTPVAFGPQVESLRPGLDEGLVTLVPGAHVLDKRHCDEVLDTVIALAQRSFEKCQASAYQFAIPIVVGGEHESAEVTEQHVRQHFIVVGNVLIYGLAELRHRSS